MRLLIAATAAAGLLTALAPVHAAAKIVGGEKKAAAPAEPRHYLRVVDENDVVALEIATRQFVRADGGPRVGLVGVAHIGETSFYRDLQRDLGEYEIVLYESVLPPGAGGAEGDNDTQRVAGTEAAMQFVASLVETYRVRGGRYPETMDELDRFLGKRDTRLARWGQRAMTDAWGSPIEYGFTAAAADSAERFTLTSFGADGGVGGSGADADLVVSTLDRVEAMKLSGDENLQTALAAALDLEFQLEAMDYDGDNWRCSDMAMDQIEVALAERGLEFGPFSNTLSGTSLPSKLIKGFLKIIRVADMFLDGAIADTCTLVLIETLGDEAMIEQSMQQMGAGFEEVIVGERNARVIRDLEAMIGDEPDVASVAIFYGAAHMADFEEKLAAIGYHPADDQHPVRWLRAMEVDLAASAMSERELKQIRMMVKQAFQQQR